MPEGGPPVLFASAFRQGRTDRYRINDDGNLTRRRKGSTRTDLRTTPVRMTIGEFEDTPGSGEVRRVLYVAAGQADRVQAYRLRKRDRLRSKPFSQTDVLKDSFPNDVAIAELTGPCPR